MILFTSWNWLRSVTLFRSPWPRLEASRISGFYSPCVEALTRIVRVDVWLCARACVHAENFVHRHTSAHAQTQTHTRICIYIYTHTNVCTPTYARQRASIDTNTYTPGTRVCLPANEVKDARVVCEQFWRNVSQMISTEFAKGNWIVEVRSNTGVDNPTLCLSSHCLRDMSLTETIVDICSN